MADENARELSRREERLFNRKANIDTLNQELALNFYPERADFTTERALGDEFAIDLYDSEPVRCRRDLGNARASMLRPAGREWARAETTDPQINKEPQTSRFLDWINQRLRAEIYQPDTGFVEAEKAADQDLVTFGNAVKTVESEIDRDGKRIMLIRNWHLRDMAWLDDKTGVRQDYAARRFKASARHIRQMFPEAELHADVQKALDEDKDKEFNLCHVMMRADEYEYNRKPKRGRKAPWVSVYYDSEHKMLLRERPSERFRYVIDRWGRISGSQYGYSPAAMTALPDARGMQTMMMVYLEAGEKQLDPPLLGVRKAIIGEVDVSAGAINWVDGDKYNETMGAALAPLLPHNRDLGVGIDMLNRTTLSQRDIWFLTKLTLPQNAKTAYETAQLVEEFIRANIPLFEPWEAGTAMMLDEIFGVLMDMGAFGRVEAWPEVLSGGDIVFKFANPLQDAIERNKVNQAQQALGIVAGAGQIDPNVRHAIDVMRMVQDAVRGTGAPAEWLADEDAAAQAAQAQAQAGNILTALGAAGQAADVVNTGAEAAAKLQALNQPAVDQSAVYGPI